MFSKTERLLAWRYLKSRKRTGFVSVIAGFSFLGIMLGVATLIIVMSVMNGFKEELLGRVLGINGQMGVYPAWGDTLADFEKKLENLKLFYEKAIPKVGWEKYSIINLKYKNQIVCTKK